MSDQTPNPKDRQPSAGAAPRWMRVTLILSLSLNLLIIVAFLGAAANGGGKWREAGSSDRMGGPLTRAFAEEDQRALKRKVARKAIADRETRRAQRQVMTDMVAALRTTPFNPTDMVRHMKRMRDLVGRRFDTTQGVLVNHIASMSDAERSVLADRLEKELERRK